MRIFALLIISSLSLLHGEVSVTIEDVDGFEPSDEHIDYVQKFAESIIPKGSNDEIKVTFGNAVHPGLSYRAHVYLPDVVAERYVVRVYHSLYHSSWPDRMKEVLKEWGGVENGWSAKRIVNVIPRFEIGDKVVLVSFSDEVSRATVENILGAIGNGRVDYGDLSGHQGLTLDDPISHIEMRDGLLEITTRRGLGGMIYRGEMNDNTLHITIIGFWVS